MYIHTSVDPPPILSPNHPPTDVATTTTLAATTFSASFSILLSLSLSLFLSLSRCFSSCYSNSRSSFIHPSRRVCCTRLQPTDRPLLAGKDQEPNNHAANRFTSRPRCLRLASIKMSVAKNIPSVADELITERSRVPDSCLVLS